MYKILGNVALSMVILPVKVVSAIPQIAMSVYIYIYIYIYIHTGKHLFAVFVTMQLKLEYQSKKGNEHVHITHPKPHGNVMLTHSPVRYIDINIYILDLVSNYFIYLNIKRNTHTYIYISTLTLTHTHTYMYIPTQGYTCKHV